MTNSEYKIVLPIKFSHSCEKIINAIKAFKNGNDYRLYLIRICDKKANEVNELEKLNIWLSERGVTGDAVVRKGNVAEQVVSFSEEVKASAIIIDKEWGSGEEDKSTIGDISTKIIETSHIPVVIFKSDISLNDISSILLPLDVTEENKKKISNAIFFSKFFNGAMIRLMSVVLDVNDYVLNRNMFQLQHLVHFIEKAGCECTGEIMRCSAADGDTISKGVVDYARRSEAEIVLLMTEEERFVNSDRINEQSAYMLAHLDNHIITLTP